MTTDQELRANASRALELWTELQGDSDAAEWVGKTVGVDTATGELFFGCSTTDIPKRPAVVIVQISKLDAERRRLRLGGRWRRVNPRTAAVGCVTPEFPGSPARGILPVEVMPCQPQS